jgi:hypothetical protein
MFTINFRLPVWRGNERSIMVLKQLAHVGYRPKIALNERFVMSEERSIIYGNWARLLYGRDASIGS